MHIGFLYNPISGRGRGQRDALQCGAMLEAARFKVSYFQSQPDYTPATAAEILKELDLLIICGGDGTVQRLLPFLAESQVPLYVIPAGVENLFARNFGMTNDGVQLLATLKQVRVTSTRPWWTEHHFGIARAWPSPETLTGPSSTVSFPSMPFFTIPFFTMASIGLDADVVCTICERRSKPIGRCGYVLPTLRTVFSHRSHTISVKVDGEDWITNQAGFLIIANAPQYALGVPWLPLACSRNEQLIARFIGYNTGFDFIKLALGLKFPGPIKIPAPPSDRSISGKIFEVTAASADAARATKSTSDQPTAEARPVAVQADGDFAGFLPCSIAHASQSLRVFDVHQLTGRPPIT